MKDRVNALTPIEYAAYHEAGHAVACTLAWRLVQRPPDAPPVPPGPAIVYVEVTKGKSGSWGGLCKTALQLYSTTWPESRIDEKWRNALEWEIIFTLAGGIAEAIYRGECYSHTLLRFVVGHCGMAWEDTGKSGRISDFHYFIALRDDLWKLERGGLARPTQRTFTLIKKHWPAVEAIAAELLRSRRIDGADVERICDQATRGRIKPARNAGDLSQAAEAAE